MTDDLETLKAALQRRPQPDAAAKADHIALAMKNFDALQGSPDGLRPNSDRPDAAGIWHRIGPMLTGLTTRPMLAGTASVAALCLAFVAVNELPAPVADVTGPRQQPETALSGERDVTVAAPPAAEPQKVVAGDGASGAATELAGRADELARVDAPSADALASLAPTETETRLREEAAPPLDAPMAVTEAEPPPEPQLQLAKPAVTESDGARRALGGVAAEGMIADGVIGYPAPDMVPMQEPDTEAFSNEAPNPVRITAEEPVSTFSIDVDTASYGVVRSSLNLGQLPPPEAVRIEEMVNYFPYAYPAPSAEDGPFRPTVTVMPTPWNPGTRLVHIGIQGRLPETDARPALNLVFLVDTSGSMDEPNRLPLLQQSLALVLGQLRPEDQVAIVAYAGSAGVVLPPTGAGDAGKINAALMNLYAGGSTAGAEGMELAYQVAQSMGAEGEVSRVILATDGDFNVGVSDPEGLEAYVARKRDTGIYLSVLGFGRGNLDDAVMQALAQNGNGTASYIDTLSEARKVLVDQLTGALFPIADDVKIQIEWNPAAVAEYRLIGYETRALRREDFNNDRIDAGEIGAGASVTAIYEITPPGSGAALNDPLRYGPEIPEADPGAAELGFLKLRYKEPGADASVLKETPIMPATGAGSEDARFAVAIAGMGQLLTGATYLGDWGWDDAIALALGSRGQDPFGYRIEAVNLMRMAQTLSAR
jgi:Ca-activated chloride channel homolog